MEVSQPDQPLHPPQAVEMEFASLEDKKLRDKLRNVAAMEAEITALQVAALKKVGKGTKVGGFPLPSQPQPLLLGCSASALLGGTRAILVCPANSTHLQASCLACIHGAQHSCVPTTPRCSCSTAMGQRLAPWLSCYQQRVSAASTSWKVGWWGATLAHRQQRSPFVGEGGEAA